MAMSAGLMNGAIAAIAAPSPPCGNIAAGAWSAAISPRPLIAAGKTSPVPVPPAATSVAAIGGLTEKRGGSDLAEPPLVPTARRAKVRGRNHLLPDVFRPLPLCRL